MIRKNKIHWAIAIIILTIIFIVFWFTLRPIKIIAVHHRSSGFSDILVDHFPLTTKGKVDWWLKNREMLKSCYGIPKPASHGTFSLTFWIFGDGYIKEEKYDYLCFEDNKRKKCIEKNSVLTVENGKSTGLFFILNDGIYRIDQKGDLIKDNHE